MGEPCANLGSETLRTACQTNPVGLLRGRQEIMTSPRYHDAVKRSVLRGALKLCILPLLPNHMQNVNFGIQMIRISFQMIPTGLFRDEMLEKCALKRYRLPAKRPLRDFLGTSCCQQGVSNATYCLPNDRYWSAWRPHVRKGALKRYIMPAE